VEHPAPEPPPEPDDLDEYLSPGQERQLRTSPAEVALYWQVHHGCADPGCLRCRVGRALAVLCKASVDAQAAADVLCALEADLLTTDDADLSERMDTVAYHSYLQILLKVLQSLNNAGMGVARSMGKDAEAPPGTGIVFDPAGQYN